MNLNEDTVHDDSSNPKYMLKYYIDAFKQYATFSGRATRSAFWYFQLVHVIVLGILYITTLDIIFGIYSLLLIIPSFAIGARRLHDIGRTGWWQLIVLIPVIGSIVLFIFCVLKSQLEDNKFDIY